MSPRNWPDRLRDIVGAIEEILAFTRGMDLKAFAADAKTQRAVLADVALIGEAARHVPAGITEAHPEIPWRDMQDMRNFVVHAYFSVEPAIVWDTVTRDLPNLAEALRALLENEAE